MIKRLSILLLVVLVLPFANIARAQTISPFVTISGNALTYNGAPVVLRGENFPNLPALDAWASANGTIDKINTDQTDYQTLAAMGANHARLGLNFRWYSTSPKAFFAAIDQQVAWAKTYHLWLILNLFTTPSNCYEGYNNHCSLWGSTSEQDSLNTFWTAVALHYKNEPTVAGYDLLNEPTPPQSGEQWYTLAERLCASIAGVDPNHFVVVESLSDPKFPRLLNCPRIVYSIHIYAPIGFTTSGKYAYPGSMPDNGGGHPYNAQTLAGVGGDAQTDFQTRYSIHWAASKNVPIYIGEWGARNQAPGNLQYIADLVTAFNTWGISYAHYDMRHNKGEWGIFAMNGPLNATMPLNPGLYSVMAAAFRGSVQPDGGSTTPAPTIVVALPTVSPTPTAPVTNTVPPAPTAIAVIPTLTPAPCPAPIAVSETIDGVTYSGTLTAVCQ